MRTKPERIALAYNVPGVGWCEIRNPKDDYQGQKMTVPKDSLFEDDDSGFGEYALDRFVESDSVY